MKVNQYCYNQVIYDEGDEVKNFYLIKDGEVEISKNIDLNNDSILNN